MVRTQIQLTETQVRRLKRIARERHVSMASLIRESIDRYVGDSGKDSPARERALAIIGKFSSGDTDFAERHDEYLADSYL
jgi:hypothetical protein